MIDEKRAEEYCNNEGRPKWHKVADGDLPTGGEYGETSIHRKIYLKDRFGNLYKEEGEKTPSFRWGMNRLLS